MITTCRYNLQIDTRKMITGSKMEYTRPLPAQFGPGLWPPACLLFKFAKIKPETGKWPADILRKITDFVKGTHVRCEIVDRCTEPHEPFAFNAVFHYRRKPTDKLINLNQWLLEQGHVVTTETTPSTSKISARPVNTAATTKAPTTRVSAVAEPDKKASGITTPTSMTGPSPQKSNPSKRSGPPPLVSSNSPSNRDASPSARQQYQPASPPVHSKGASPRPQLLATNRPTGPELAPLVMGVSQLRPITRLEQCDYYKLIEDQYKKNMGTGDVTKPVLQYGWGLYKIS
eukprot:sb/3467715/